MEKYFIYSCSLIFFFVTYLARYKLEIGTLGKLLIDDSKKTNPKSTKKLIRFVLLAIIVFFYFLLSERINETIYTVGLMVIGFISALMIVGIIKSFTKIGFYENGIVTDLGIIYYKEIEKFTFAEAQHNYLTRIDFSFKNKKTDFNFIFVNKNNIREIEALLKEKTNRY